MCITVISEFYPASLQKDSRRLEDEINAGGVLGGKNLSGNHAEMGVRRGPLEDEVISKPTLTDKPLIRKHGAVAPALRKHDVLSPDKENTQVGR